jgi:hypothetical protein
MPFALVLPEDEAQAQDIRFPFLSLLRVVILCCFGIDFLFGASYINTYPQCPCNCELAIRGFVNSKSGTACLSKKTIRRALERSFIREVGLKSLHFCI